MSTLNIVLAILLFASALFLIIAVLIQSGKSKGVSSAIAGGASETYFGKNKGKSRDKKLSLLTTIVAIVFAVLALITYVTQDYIDERELLNSGSSTTTTTSKKDDADKDDKDETPGDDKDDNAGSEGGDSTTSSSDTTGSSDNQ